jgi:hypothetical protein
VCAFQLIRLPHRRAGMSAGAIIRKEQLRKEQGSHSQAIGFCCSIIWGWVAWRVQARLLISAFGLGQHAFLGPSGRIGFDYRQGETQLGIKERLTWGLGASCGSAGVLLSKGHERPYKTE